MRGKTVVIAGAYVVTSTPVRSKPSYDRDIAARHWAISEALVGLSDGHVQSPFGDSEPRRDVQANDRVTESPVARTSKERSLIAASHFNDR
jgi:hypothetical protein